MLAGTATQSAAVLPCRGIFLFDRVVFLLGMLFLRSESRHLQHIRVVQAVQQGIHLALIRAFRLFSCYHVALHQLSVDGKAVFMLCRDWWAYLNKQVSVGCNTALQIFLHRRSIPENFSVLTGYLPAIAGIVRVMRRVECN